MMSGRKGLFFLLYFEYVKVIHVDRLNHSWLHVRFVQFLVRFHWHFLTCPPFGSLMHIHVWVILDDLDLISEKQSSHSITKRIITNIQIRIRIKIRCTVNDISTDILLQEMQWSNINEWRRSSCILNVVERHWVVVRNLVHRLDPNVWDHRPE